jgi:hypothetical protein
MRSFIIVPCLVAATIVLQGCGGGGSTPAPAPVTQCVNPQIDVKSQSVTSTTKSAMTTYAANTTIEEVIDGTTTTKIDMEQMNLYENTVSTASTTVSGEHPISTDLKTELKIIVHVAKKVLVESYKVTNVTSGKILIANCSAMTVAAMPPASEVSMLFKAVVVPKLQEVASCSHNDGTYDHYDMKIDFQAASLPGGLLPQVSDVNVHGTETFLLDKDYVMHSATGKLKASAKLEGMGLETIDETTDSTSTDAKVGGPTAADLDYSSWGKCTLIPKEDVSTFFQPTKPSEITNKFNNKAFFKNQLLVAIQAAIKATETKKLIV